MKRKPVTKVSDHPDGSFPKASPPRLKRLKSFCCNTGGRNGFADFGCITPNQGRKRHSPFKLFGKRREVLPFAVAAIKIRIRRP